MPEKSSRSKEARKPRPESKGSRPQPASAARVSKAEPAAPSRTPAPGNKPFLIVGVGASAGGYEAFAQLLQNLSPKTGMAFVLVQHLDPRHESKLSELLSRATEMRVVEIRNQTLVEPNHLYVIPPNRSLTVEQGVLQLKPRVRLNGPDLPIDRFFESLAEDQGNRAVGIILSGNGMDGTQGLRRIKAEGGITFVQDERTAKFHGMPSSALLAGHVDFVLSPRAMAKELERIARCAPLLRVRPAARPGAGVPAEETELTRIFGLLRALTGVDFTYYKQTTLKRRITRRMVLRKIGGLREYLKLLQQNPAEVDLLFNDILINVTGFFRDPKAFAALKKRVFPRIARQKPGSPIRFWVPGCSTGEEVYSLAICLHEFLGRNASAKSMQIFGTDISETMVGRARLGIYPESIASQVSPERLRRYFTRVNRGYQISKFIRDVCIFAKQNVAEDPPFSKLDLISCRNLLIYLGPVLQKKVMPVFHYSLRPGGYLMLGSSETIGSFASLFTLVDKRNKIYSKVETRSRPEIEFLPAAAMEKEVKPAPAREDLSQFDLQRRADEILLSQYTPGGIVINSRMEAIHFRGRIGYYLEPAPGTATLNLLKMVREELVVDLRTAVAQAGKSNTPVRKEPVRIRYNGHYREVTLEVVPFRSAPLSERFFLVLFHDAMGSMEEEKAAPPRARTMHQHAQREIRRLREEIAQTKDSLQTIIEEQEATNEELKSANEEIQSSNEELQSTNEELETAKEELQSTNEELTTLNEELQNRNAELNQVNNDLNNLIGSFNMPILILGNDLAIRRFTPLAEKVFNLIPGDVGRRVSDINPNIVVPHLDKLVQGVIETLNMKDVEVQDREGHWFSLRIRPYRTSENRIEGAVLVVVDIGDIRQTIDEITDMTAQPMLILNEALSVARASEKFCAVFGVARKQVEGRSVFEVDNRRWDTAAFRQLLERILPEERRVENYRIEPNRRGRDHGAVFVSARRLFQPSKGTHYIVIRFDSAGPEKSSETGA